MFCIHSANDDLATLPGLRWKIAFKGDAKKLIGESEIKNYFGG
jgi:hypothetical protein